MTDTNERINQLIQKAKQTLKNQENSESSKSYSSDDSHITEAQSKSSESIIVNNNTQKQNRTTELIDFDTHVFNAFFSRA